MRHLIDYCLMCLLGFLIPCVAEGSIVVADGNFGPHWDKFHITINTGTGTFDSASNLATGGNPDAYRRSFHEHGGFGPTSPQTLLFNINTSFVFDPSKGPLTEVSVEFDGILFDSLNGQVQFGPGIRQGGNQFLFDTMASGQETDLGAWKHYEFNSLTEGNFVNFPSNPSVNPDFSSAGSPIEFGYFSFASSNGTTASVTSGVDNWQLTVNSQPGMDTVPEPSSFVIWSVLSLIGAGVGWQRKRRGGPVTKNCV